MPVPLHSWAKPHFLPQGLHEGYDSYYFLLQEKRKPEFLKGLPDQLKLYSEFLGKQPWFAGDKVERVAGGQEELPFFPGIRIPPH